MDSLLYDFLVQINENYKGEKTPEALIKWLWEKGWMDKKHIKKVCAKQYYYYCAKIESNYESTLDVAAHYDVSYHYVEHLIYGRKDIK